MNEKIRVYLSNLKTKQLESMPIDEIKQKSVSMDITIIPNEEIYEELEKNPDPLINPQETIFSYEVCGNFKTKPINKTHVYTVLDTMFNYGTETEILADLKKQVDELNEDNNKLEIPYPDYENNGGALVGDTELAYSTTINIEKGTNSKTKKKDFTIHGNACFYSYLEPSIIKENEVITPKHVIRLMEEWVNLINAWDSSDSNYKKRQQFSKQKKRIHKRYLGKPIEEKSLNLYTINQNPTDELFGSIAENIWIKQKREESK